MFVGICNVHIHIAWAQSLKNKRQAIKSIIGKLKHKFNISIAEVGSQDLWQYSVLGITTVSSSELIVRQTIESAVDNIELIADVQVLKHEIELVK